ncbi:afadin- and alpha-actinin-binding protein A-like [Anneissia japonica]|uniref:afadin- and alpha-actinin-binding protein A-like n=1 Tax=Anneissia japonica TaxID=1529436 RepID=UPI0014257A5E|nr:afadin- and alpha-actinin-binding protein A-like [Anneissia japonica]XP_033127471.1 afadin- and alpha-actinin-binding protein A-like [Anneissia japonica]XP_033127472.1 afadin- and alpha-actinin-binding protein A-like [Anneissia japonica]XP_033127473.1 afadin- and alpha-actinin-binding protein A-like [Anneissia japonica]
MTCRLVMAGWETSGTYPFQSPQSITHDDFIDTFVNKSYPPRQSTLNALKFSPSPRKSGTMFCTRDNIDQCVSYLDQEITLLGFQSLYTPAIHESTSAGTFDVTKLINCCFDLMQRHQETRRFQEELENKRIRCDSDLDHLNVTCTRLKEQLEQQQRDNVALVEKERQHILQNKGLNNKLKATKEEIKKLDGINRHRDTQFKHDLKKKEREASKLKERIHQLLTDKNQERRIGMDILNSIQRSDGKRSKWKTGRTGEKHEEDMYRLIITNYEERQEELMGENRELRESLSNMQKELVDLLNQQTFSKTDSNTCLDGDEAMEEDGYHDASDEELSSGHFQMPFDMVREGIESSMRRKWRKLKEKIRKMETEAQIENKENSYVNNSTSQSQSLKVGQQSEIEQYQKQINKLQLKLSTYKDIIEQQEQLLQSVSSPKSDESFVQFLKDSHLLEEKDSFARDKELFYQQKAAFEQERRNFTEAAIRLGHERKKFEEERSTFLQHQISMTPQVSNPTPPPLRPAKSISKSPSPNLSSTSSVLSSKLKHDCLVSTPPTSRRTAKVVTPSTVELYRALKLTSETSECLNGSQESLRAKVISNPQSSPRLVKEKRSFSSEEIRIKPSLKEDQYPRPSSQLSRGEKQSRLSSVGRRHHKPSSHRLSRENLKSSATDVRGSNSSLNSLESDSSQGSCNVRLSSGRRHKTTVGPTMKRGGRELPLDPKTAKKAEQHRVNLKSSMTHRDKNRTRNGTPSSSR